MAQVEFLNARNKEEQCPTAFTKKVRQQILKYFSNPSYTIECAVQLTGTPFQEKVWHALKSLPPGQTITYGKLAQMLHTSPRAIGQACRTNPCPLVIPCHRVVAQNGIGGFSGQTGGSTWLIKKQLIQLEAQLSSNAARHE